MDLKFDKCPICHREIDGYRTDDYGEIVRVKCPYCGSFKITSFVLKGWLHERQKKHDPDIDMSIALRHVSSHATEEIELTDKNYHKIKNSIRIPSDPIEVLDILMLYCGRAATRFNVGISIPKSDIPLLFMHDENEMQAVLVIAQELDYIGQYYSKQNNYEFSLLVKGWERIIQLRNVRSESKQVFIAMRFGDPD